MTRLPRTSSVNFPRSALALLGLCLSAAFAQSSPPPATSVPAAVAPVISPGKTAPKITKSPALPEVTASTGISNSAMDAELFYELLLSELSVQSNEPGAGFSLVLNAARRSNDAQLYQRAVELALQSRSGEAALQAARAWHQAQPASRPANRALLQILLALNRLSDTLEPLKTELMMAGPQERTLAIAAIPRSYLQASDKKLAASIVEQAMTEYTSQPATAAAAWLAIGRMRLGNDDLPGTMEAAQRAQISHGSDASIGPAMLALELMERKQPNAEALVRSYIDSQPAPEIRMAYARVLADLRRYPESMVQLQKLTVEKADYAESWLLLGTLQLQERQTDSAESSLKRYVELAKTSTEDNAERTQDRNRALAQAYLSLAQIAEDRKDYAAAEAWIARIDNAQDLIGAQSRRASILAHQGRMDEARKLIQSLPEKTADDARMKVMTEVQLLRENKQFQIAYDLLSTAINRSPEDADLLYDQAMLAEKLQRLDEMERLLRQIIKLKPDYPQAYNALGFSLADRNVRVPEAKQLILKALKATPNDPFIQDSLGWAEFRLGNKAEALRILAAAYKAKPDVEISAHLGEVLWSLGQRAKAIAIWKQGQRLNRENETLMETLKRLHVSL